MYGLKVSSPPKKKQKSRKKNRRKVKSRRTKKAERKPQTLEDLMSSLKTLKCVNFFIKLSFINLLICISM